MEKEKLTKDKYELWNQFCLSSDDAWFWHTADWLEFHLNYKPEFKSSSFSFLLKDDLGAVAVCPLILEEINGVREFSYGGGFGMPPALRNDISPAKAKKILKEIFDEIDKLALELGVQRIRLRFSPLAPANYKNFLPMHNYLMRFGFLDVSLNTQILDLSKEMAEIAQGLRKGHKYDIKRAEKVYQAEVFDHENIQKDIFEQYRLLHHKTSGRITRPLVTFEMMYQWILENKAILCGAKYNGSFVGFALIIVFKGNAFYASASDDPDIKLSVPISHVIQWKVVQYLKTRGTRFYELGLQQFSSQIHDFPKQKDLDIALFKRGFGGYTVPVFMGEKYYSKNYFMTVFNERIGSAAEAIFSNIGQKDEVS